MYIRNLTALKGLTTRLVLLLVMIFASCLQLPGASTSVELPAAAKTWKILYLNSYHPGYIWSDNILSGIAAGLSKRIPDKYDMQVEYLDGKRYANRLDSSLGQALHQLFREKYSGSRFDLILVSDQDAYNFLNKIRNEIFPGVPAIFTGVENPGIPAANTIGINASTDIEGNIKLILRVMPKVKRIIVLVDSSITGQTNQLQALPILERFSDRVSFLLWGANPEDTPEQFLKNAANLNPSENAIFFLDYYRTSSGGIIEPAAFITSLCKTTRAPVFSHVDLYTRYGVVGGVMNSGFLQGNQMIDIGLDLLTGSGTPTQTIIREISLPTADYTRLVACSIDPARFPAETRFLNHDEVVFQSFKWKISTLALLLTILLLLIAILIFMLRKQRHLRNEARQSAAHFQGLFKSSPNPIAICGNDGRIITFNDQFSLLLGYSHDDIPDMETWWQRAYPDSEYRRSNIAAWNKVTGQIEPGEKIETGEYQITCRNGSVKTMILSTSFLEDCFIVSFFDVTERKKAKEELTKSLSRFEALFDLSPYSCIITGLDERLLMVNRSFCQVVGCNREDVIGKTTTEIGRSYDPFLQEQQRRKLHEQGYLDCEENIVYSENSKHYVLFSARLIDWGDSKAILSATIDITARKKAEEEVRNSEKNLRITLNSIGDAVIATDTHGQITRMNPVAEKLTGWCFLEAEGRKLHEVFNIISSDTRKPVPSPVDQVLATGRIVGLGNHTVLISRDNREYQIADSGAPILADSGEVVGVILVFRDVTEEYALQAQLTQSQKMDAIGQLAGGVAHDFNNMLSGIMVATELMQQHISEADKNSHHYLQLILSSAQRAADLTRQLLTFSRKKQNVSTFIDVHEAVKDTIALLEKTIDKRINIRCSLEADHAFIVGDGSLIRNMLLNLGINAAQAMTNGGNLTFTTREINLPDVHAPGPAKVSAPGCYISLTVADTGCGIAPENLNRIFEPFFTTKPEGQGTGLGLSVVYGTIQQHKGTINVSSKTGEGTTFDILLPLADEKHVPRIENNSAPVHGSGKILLVDDESIIRATGKAILENLGYSVALAANGFDAVAAFTERCNEIDLVILDMVMPGMNGRDCFFEIQKIRPGARVLLASGFSREDDLSEMRAAGLGGFIAKPFLAAELSKMVAELIKK